MTPAVPDPFPPIHVHVLRRRRRLERIHHRDYAATSFNPGAGAPTRFAPLLRSGHPPIPHCYATTSFECAAHETVFHEVQFDADPKIVMADSLDPLMFSSLRCKRALRLASLFEPDLNRWKIRRSMLIDTYASAYGDTVKWALAVHANADVDGMIWTSKRCDPAMAMILFGDRVLTTDFEEIDSRPIGTGGHLRDRLEGFAARAGIAIIDP